MFTGTPTLGLLMLITKLLNIIYTSCLARSTLVSADTFTAYITTV